MTYPEQCEQENASGVRCVLGTGHDSKCRFRPLQLTQRQHDLLKQLQEHGGQVEVFGGGGPEARSLARYALLRRSSVGYRWWCLMLTKWGARVAAELRRGSLADPPVRP